MTPEEQLASKLELIRDAIVAVKFATEASESKSSFISNALSARVTKLESDLLECFAKIAELSSASILTSEQLRSVLKAMEVQTAATRAVQSNVIGAILVAVIISVTGTAVSTFYRSGIANQQPAIAGRAA